MNKLVVRLKNWLETSSPKQKLSVALLVFGVLSTLGLMIMTGASGASSDPLESTPLYFVGVFVKLIVVLLLIVVSSFIFRRWLQPGMGAGKNRQVRLVETIRLSPKQALHLVTVGNQQLLIGATDQGISLLTEVEVDLSNVETTSSSQPAGSDFSSLLGTLYFRSPDSSSK